MAKFLSRNDTVGVGNAILDKLGLDMTEILTMDVKRTDSVLRPALTDYYLQNLKDLAFHKSLKPAVTISAQVTTEIQVLLETNYPEFSIKFTGSKIVGHPAANASRVLELQLLLNLINFSNSVTLPSGYDAYYADIGGNWAVHFLKNNLFWHTCSPILDAQDRIRERTRHANLVSSSRTVSVDQLQIAEDLLHDKTNKYRCYRLGQDCDIRALFSIFLHSTYNMRLRDIGDTVTRKRSLLAYGCFIFDPIIMIKDSGIIKPLGIVYEVDRCNDKIKFMFVGDTSLNYEHCLSSYLSLATRSLFYDSKMNVFSNELIYNRLGIQFFKITPLGNDFKLFDDVQLTHCLWNASMLNRMLVRFFTFHKSSMRLNSSFPLKPTLLLVPEDLFFAVLNYAESLDDNNFLPKQIFSFARSVNSRVIINGKDVSTPERMDPRELLAFANAVYVHVFVKKYDIGIIVKTLLADEKQKREFNESNLLWNLAKALIFPAVKYTASETCCSSFRRWVFNRLFSDSTNTVDISECVSFTPFRSTVSLTKKALMRLLTPWSGFQDLTKDWHFPVNTDPTQPLLNVLKPFVDQTLLEYCEYNESNFDLLRCWLSPKQRETFTEIEREGKRSKKSLNSNVTTIFLNSLAFHPYNAEHDSEIPPSTATHYLVVAFDTEVFTLVNNVYVANRKLFSLDLKFFDLNGSYTSGTDISTIASSDSSGTDVQDARSIALSVVKKNLQDRSSAFYVGHITTCMFRDLELVQTLGDGLCVFYSLLQIPRAEAATSLPKVDELRRELLHSAYVRDVPNFRTNRRILEATDPRYKRGTLDIIDLFARTRGRRVCVHILDHPHELLYGPLVVTEDPIHIRYDSVNEHFDFLRKRAIDINQVDNPDGNKFHGSCDNVQISRADEFVPVPDTPPSHTSARKLSKFIFSLLATFPRYWSKAFGLFVLDERISFPHRLPLRHERTVSLPIDNLEKYSHLIYVNSTTDCELEDILYLVRDRVRRGNRDFSFILAVRDVTQSWRAFAMNILNVKFARMNDNYIAILCNSVKLGERTNTQVRPCEIASSSFDQLCSFRNLDSHNIQIIACETIDGVSIYNYNWRFLSDEYIRTLGTISFFGDIGMTSRKFLAFDAAKSWDCIIVGKFTNDGEKVTDIINYCVGKTCRIISTNTSFLKTFRKHIKQEYSNSSVTTMHLEQVFSSSSSDISHVSKQRTASVISQAEIESAYASEVTNSVMSVSTRQQDTTSLSGAGSLSISIHKCVINNPHWCETKADGYCCYYALLEIPLPDAERRFEEVETLRRTLLMSQHLRLHPRREELTKTLRATSGSDMYGNFDVLELYVRCFHINLCVHVEGTALQTCFFYSRDAPMKHLHYLVEREHYQFLLPCEEQSRICLKKPDSKDKKTNILSNAEKLNKTISLPQKTTIDTLLSVNNEQFSSDLGSLELHWRNSRAFMTTYTGAEPLYETGTERDSFSRNAVREQLYYWMNIEIIQRKRYRELYARYICSSGLRAGARRMFFRERENLGIIDNSRKSWVVKPREVLKYEAAFDGVEFVRLTYIDTSRAPFCDFKSLQNRYLLVGNTTEVLNDNRLYNATKSWVDRELENFQIPVIRLLQAVPGNGKTEYTIRTHNREKDIILTTTKEAAADLRRRVNVDDRTARDRYATTHSYLINGTSACERLFVDEALTCHAGELVLLAMKSHCKELVLIGDTRQIPFINRTNLAIRFSDPCRLAHTIENRNITYRCPRDVAVLFGGEYESGMLSVSSVIHSVHVQIIDNINGVPFDAQVQYLVFKQSEKIELTRKFPNVKTVHEYQGKQHARVAIVRLSRKPLEAIYKSKAHMLVACTRHTRELWYYTVIHDDLSQKLRTKITDEQIRAVTLVAGGRIEYVPALYARQRDVGRFRTETTDMILTKNFLPDIDFTRVISGQPLTVYRNPLLHASQVAGAGYQALQVWYDYILPGNSLHSLEFDQHLTETTSNSFDLEDMVLNMSNKRLAKERRTTLKSRLRTAMPERRVPSFLETIFALVKRNLNIPELDGDIDQEFIINLMVEKFEEAFIPDCNRDIYNNFISDPVTVNSRTLTDWLLTQPSEIVSQMNSEFSVFDSVLNVYHLMNKPTVKPTLDTKAPFEYNAVQTIAYHSKDINAVFCVLFRELKKRLLSLLHPKFLIFCDMSPQDFATEISARFDGKRLMSLDKLEIDISKYDKSQGRLLFEYEMILYERLGLPKWALNLWRQAHEDTVLKDYEFGVKAFIGYQRKSGDASTFFGNTLVLMGVISTIFDLTSAEAAFFAGDDSIIFGGEIDVDRNMLCANIFNLESKFFHYRFPYFCSKFLVYLDGVWEFIPDPVKLVTKLGRNDLVDWDHVEEYRISLYDLTKPFGNAAFNRILNHALNERYPSCLHDHTFAFASIYQLVKNKEQFHNLYYLRAGETLIIDPSRPKLE